MSVRETLVESAKKATEVSIGQVHAYLGANDYWYEQVRTTPARYKSLQETVAELPVKLRKLGEDGIDVASAVEPYAPANLRRTIQARVEEARQRRNDLAERGERIAQDWHTAAAVKDLDALVSTVRKADGASELARSVRTWIEDYPAETGTKRTSTVASKPAAQRASKPAAKPAAKSAAKPATKRTSKPAAKPAAARTTTARKATARKTTARKAAAE